MVVKDIYLGNAHIKIHDDYIVKTPEEVQAILKRCAEIVKTDESFFGGFIMENLDIRNQAKAAGVFLWEIARYFNISEPTITRKMRTEMSETEKRQFLQAIETIKIEKAKRQLAEAVKTIKIEKAKE